jgi:hypothetical protein
MSVLASPEPVRRQAAVSWFLVFIACLILAASTLGPRPTSIVGAGVGAVVLVGAGLLRRPYIPWHQLLALLILVILFIPLRRYKFPGDAGVSLEPYRLLVALMLAAWSASLLVDGRIRLRGSGLGVALALIMLAVMGSVLANPARASEMQPAVLKSVTFLLSFMVVFYLVVSVVRSGRAADLLLKTLVAGGAVVAVLAVIEARIGFTPFTHLDVVFPILKQDAGFESGLSRGGATRAVGSAEHPIALGAALVMLVPLAVYLVRVAGSQWYFALGALVVGALSTVSRTGILMLVIIGIVFLWLRGPETRRLWPVLIPLVVATHFAVPGALGALHSAFFPEGGIVSQQEGMAGSCSSSGRVADLGPTLDEVGRKPFLGYGYGTRVVTGPDSNACILDNQWLGTLYEVGVAGMLAWLLLFVAVGRRFGRRARRDRSPAGWLLACITASVLAFAVGMLTFDALGFSQVVFLLFLILGIGAAVAANEPEPPPGVFRPPPRLRLRDRLADAASA